MNPALPTPSTGAPVEPLLARVERLLAARPASLDPAVIRRAIDPWLAETGVWAAAAERFGTPLWVVDTEVTTTRARAFAAAATAAFGQARTYFAVKSHNRVDVARACVAAGIGLDVSSGVELQLAQAAGATAILFTGPAKTDAELAAAVAARDCVILALDSMGELRRVAALGNTARPLDVLVRVSADAQGAWTKFGVPVAALPAFLAAAAATPTVRVIGVQFHTSWNMNPSRQARVIEAIGAALAAVPDAQRRHVRVIDVGGGYWPEMGEWLDDGHTDGGRLAAMLHAAAPPCGTAVASAAPRAAPHHYCVPATPLPEHLATLARAIAAHVPLPADREVWCEPGRWISHDAATLVIRVRDVKAPGIAITDAGTNVFGWERLEHEYLPVLNATRPAGTELPFTLYGALCTPHDVWGQAVFASAVADGDVLVLPFQGAYTLSLEQDFIKPRGRVVTRAALRL